MFNPLSSKAPCERSEASSERRWDWLVLEEKGTRTGKEAVERHRECKALNLIRSFCLLQVQCPLGHWSVLSGLTKKEIQKRLRFGFLTKTYQGCSWICSLTSFFEFLGIWTVFSWNLSSRKRDSCFESAPISVYPVLRSLTCYKVWKLFCCELSNLSSSSIDWLETNLYLLNFPD